MTLVDFRLQLHRIRCTISAVHIHRCRHTVLEQLKRPQQLLSVNSFRTVFDISLSYLHLANNDSTPVSTANKPARPPPPRQESIRERSKLAGKSSSLEIDTTNIVGESAVRIMPPKMDSECSERSDCSTIRSQGSSSGGSTELPPPSVSILELVLQYDRI
jgi:hypothetical protein